SRLLGPQPSPRRHWPIVVGLAVVVLSLVGLITRTVVQRNSKAESDRRLKSASDAPSSQIQANDTNTGVDLGAVANQLFWSVNPLLPENQYFTQFAKEKLSWI